MVRRTTVIALYFFLGAYAVCAQATLLREAQVLLFGSELSWGLVLAFWLAGVAFGAQAAGRSLKRVRRPWLFFAASGLAMPPFLAAAIVFLRLARPLLGIGAGEYVGLGDMIWVALVATVPVSVWIGSAFPAASAILGRSLAPTRPAASASERARSVGWVYLTESAGALVGGALFSFVFVVHLDAFAMAVGGGAVLAAAVAGLVSTHARWRPAALLVLACAVVHAALVLSGVTDWLNVKTVRWRWQTFAPGLELVRSEDSKYQNLAVGRLGDQFSLYTNGTVAATWPNHFDLAIEAHLAACEQPAPRRMLLLGGGLEGLAKELLRYRPDRLDVVTLDRDLVRLVLAHLDEPDADAASRLSGHIHYADARRFVKRAARDGERYDLVILAAPEPASTLEARLYTEEFFAELARAMSDDGVLAFSLTASVGHWGPEVAAYVGSIVFPLEQVFPDVLLTFGNPMRIFAAKREGVLAKTGAALAERCRSRRIESPYFKPLWFEGASDLLDPEKRAAVRRALEARMPQYFNTDEQPAAALYHMRLWLATSKAAHAGPEAPAERPTDILGSLLRLKFEWVTAVILGATVLAATLSLLGGRRGLRQTALLWSVGTTGFASMALEIVLLYTFQTLYGYVYSMVGLVIGIFMFGLVVGSWLMNRRLRSAAGRERPGERSRAPGLRTVLALDLAVTVFAAALVLVLAVLRASVADWPVQVATFALVGISGVLGGLVFPLAAAVALREQASTERVAGAIDAADHVGACAGALVTGVVLVPVLGISGTCLVVATMKVLSSLFVGAAATTRPMLSPAPSA
ncbi:MAG: hypothetical protein WBC59_04880 [Phycisphaerae bacterium]